MGKQVKEKISTVQFYVSLWGRAAPVRLLYSFLDNLPWMENNSLLVYVFVCVNCSTLAHTHIDHLEHSDRRNKAYPPFLLKFL